MLPLEVSVGLFVIGIPLIILKFLVHLGLPLPESFLPLDFLPQLLCISYPGYFMEALGIGAGDGKMSHACPSLKCLSNSLLPLYM